MARWVADVSCDLKLPEDDRLAISAAIFSFTLDTGDSIIFLLERNLPGPAFALARLHLESYVSGIWYLDYASDEARKKYKSGVYPKLETMKKALKKSNGSVPHWITENIKLNLSDFHTLAHPSVAHVIRRYSDSGVIEPNYPEEEIRNIVLHTIQTQIGATAYLLTLAEDEKGLMQLMEKAEEYRKRALTSQASRDGLTAAPA